MLTKFSLHNEGQTPVYSSESTNNGIVGYTDNQAEFIVSKDNPIYIIFGDNTRSFNIATESFCVMDNVKVLTINKIYSIKKLIYIISSWKRCIPNKGYSRHWTFAKNILFNLPILKNGKIDFDFMENFIAEIENDRIANLNAYLTANNLKDYNLSTEEQKVLEDFEKDKIKFGVFKIGELFDIATGRDVIIGSVLDGNIPLISHQHNDNGISKKIALLSNRRLFNFKNTLSLADRGVFLASTQNEDFHIGTRVKALKFKDSEKTLKNRLFYVTSINKLQILFTDYSSNATDNLPNLNITLPIKNAQPNYALMETLIGAIQKLVIKEVVLYVNNKTKK